MDARAQEIELEVLQLQEHWYGDMVRYYRDSITPTTTRTEQARFKKQAANFRFFSANGRLVGMKIIKTPWQALEQRTVWLTCISPHEVAPILHALHDEKGHFNARIILSKLKARQVYAASALPRRTRSIPSSFRRLFQERSFRESTMEIILGCSLPPTGYLAAMDLEFSILPRPKTLHPKAINATTT